MSREIPERRIKPEARKLVKKGIYSSLRQAVKALRRGHSEKGNCPWTGKPFRRLHGPEHGTWGSITKVKEVPFCSK